MAVRENVKTDLTRINSLTSFHDYLQFGRMLHPVVGPNDSGKKIVAFFNGAADAEKRKG